MFMPMNQSEQALTKDNLFMFRGHQSFIAVKLCWHCETTICGKNHTFLLVFSTFYYFLRCCLVKSHLVHTIQLEWADVEELWSLFWREIQCVNKACGLTYVESCYNVMTARQCQSRSVNRDMEISHGIMQGLPENKMFTSRFSYIEIFFLEFNSYGICMIARNIICLSWIIVKDQGISRSCDRFILRINISGK